MTGTPVALSPVIPTGTWPGAHFRWRHTFVAISALSVIPMVWTILAGPDYPEQAISQKLRLTPVWLIPGIQLIPRMFLTWMIAHSILYACLVPLLAPSGPSSNVDGDLLIFGLATMFGIFITGWVTDSSLRITELLSLSVFTLVLIIFGISSTSPSMVYPGIAVWGLTFGDTATLLRIALTDSAGEYADIALLMNVLIWNSAIAPGSLTGGLLLQNKGRVLYPGL